MDSVIVMFGLVFIVNIIGDVFKSYKMQDCKNKKIRELGERVEKLEEKLHEQKI